MQVNNIFCVGRNYKLHAKELGNEVPPKPMIFGKPTNALTVTDNQIIPMPKGKGEIHYEVELVIHINKSYETGMKAADCVDQIAVGIDFTMRDVQNELKKKGHPWLLAKGFVNSAVVTPFFPIIIEQLNDCSFGLKINGQTVQHGDPKDMIFSFDTIVQYIAENFGLCSGDIIFTGTPAGVGAISNGDLFELYFSGEKKGSFTIEL